MRRILCADRRDYRYRRGALVRRGAYLRDGRFDGAPSNMRTYQLFLRYLHFLIFEGMSAVHIGADAGLPSRARESDRHELERHGYCAEGGADSLHLPDGGDRILPGQCVHGEG